MTGAQYRAIAVIHQEVSMKLQLTLLTSVLIPPTTVAASATHPTVGDVQQIAGK